MDPAKYQHELMLAEICKTLRFGESQAACTACISYPRGYLPDPRIGLLEFVFEGNQFSLVKQPLPRLCIAYHRNGDVYWCMRHQELEQSFMIPIEVYRYKNFAKEIEAFAWADLQKRLPWYDTILIEGCIVLFEKYSVWHHKELCKDLSSIEVTNL